MAPAPGALGVWQGANRRSWPLGAPSRGVQRTSLNRNARLDVGGADWLASTNYKDSSRRGGKVTTSPKHARRLVNAVVMRQSTVSHGTQVGPKLYLQPSSGIFIFLYPLRFCSTYPGSASPLQCRAGWRETRVALRPGSVTQVADLGASGCLVRPPRYLQ